MPDLTRGRTRTRLSLMAAAAALPMLLAGCGGDDLGAKPSLPSETPALWNPCDGLTVKFVNRQFAATTTKDAGTPTAPDCRFPPTKKKAGEPVLTANYQLFDGTLDELWTAMGQQKKADVRDVDVAGAEAAKIVVNAKKSQLYVTGFVANGTLFQVVNVADPTPYDVDRIVDGVEATLAKLAQHAADSGVGTD